MGTFLKWIYIVAFVKNLLIMIYSFFLWDFITMSTLVVQFHCNSGIVLGAPKGGWGSKESACNVGDLSRSLGWKIPWSRKVQPAPVFLPGKFHGQGTLVGYSLQVAKNGTWWSIWASDWSQHSTFLSTRSQETEQVEGDLTYITVSALVIFVKKGRSSSLVIHLMLITLGLFKVNTKFLVSSPWNVVIYWLQVVNKLYLL